MNVYQTSKLRVHRVEWPALVRLAVLKQPCRTVGTFVVLDSKMASTAASRQALLHMWTITLTIHGSIEHLYLWVCIVRAPWSWGQSHQGDHRPHPQVQSPVCCLVTSFPLQKSPTPQSHQRREANPNVLAFFNRPEVCDSRPVACDLRPVTHDSMPATWYPYLDASHPVKPHVVSCCFVPLQFFIHREVEIW